MSLVSVDIEAIKRIMREDLADAGIEPGIYLDQKSNTEAERVFCIHCKTLIPDVANEQGYTPESRLVRCNDCGANMHAGCVTWRSRGERLCLGCAKYPYPISGSVSAVADLTLVTSGSMFGLQSS